MESDLKRWMRLVEVMVVRDGDLRIHKNPDAAMTRRLLERSADGSLRGTVLDHAAGDLFVWDAYHGTHDVMDDFDLGGDGLRLDIYPNGVFCSLQGAAEEVDDWQIHQDRFTRWNIDPHSPSRIENLKQKTKQYLESNPHLIRAWGRVPPVTVEMKF